MYEILDYLIFLLTTLAVGLSVYYRIYTIIEKLKLALDDGVITPQEAVELIKELNIFKVFLKGINIPKD